MAEPASFNTQQISNRIEEFLQCAKCFQKKARVLSVEVKNLKDSGTCIDNDFEDRRKVLERKHDIMSEIDCVIHICEECHINLEKLEIVRIRDDRGRHHDPAADSGIESNIYSDTLSGRLSGVQDVTPHTHPQALSQTIDIQQSVVRETSTTENS